MRVLLDTQVFLWAIADSPRLSRTARGLIIDAVEVFVSAASVWEIAIKAARGRIDVDPRVVAGAIAESGFVELPITVSHALGVEQLPPHHADPFDRLLIAQALA